jgi:hypothetical protein
MSDESRDWEVPTDAPVQIRVAATDDDETPIGLAVRHKDDMLGTEVGLTIGQAAALQHNLDDLLDQLDERPAVRTRESSETGTADRGIQ